MVFAFAKISNRHSALVVTFQVERDVGRVEERLDNLLDDLHGLLAAAKRIGEQEHASRLRHVYRVLRAFCDVSRTTCECDDRLYCRLLLSRRSKSSLVRSAAPHLRSARRSRRSESRRPTPRPTRTRRRETSACARCRSASCRSRRHRARIPPWQSSRR